MGMADEGVKGMSEANKQAEEGMKLFSSQEKQITYDVPGATAYKDDVEKVIAALDEEISGLAGKDNKKARTEKEKEKKKVKDDLKYIDACKVVKGLEPKNGNFQQVVEPEKKEEVPAAVAEEKKDDDKKDKKEKPKKAQESAGISKAERDELKEKEDPGSTAAKKDDKKPEKKMLSAEATAMVATLENELNEYTEKLRTEFKYSKKEIAADPDYIELVAKVNAAKGIKQKK